MNTKRIPIIEVDYGIANNFGTHIEINKHLKKYPSLLEPILEHEFSHTTKIISVEDLKIDLAENRVNNLEMLKFMVKHPKSFLQLLPFYWSPRKGFVYDINLIVMYLIMCTTILGVVYLGVNYL